MLEQKVWPVPVVRQLLDTFIGRVSKKLLQVTPVDVTVIVFGDVSEEINTVLSRLWYLGSLKIRKVPFVKIAKYALKGRGKGVGVVSG